MSVEICNNGGSYKNYCEMPLYPVKDKTLARNDIVKFMFARTQSMFDWKGLPETIPKRVLEKFLQINGFVAWIQHEDNVYVVYGALGGTPDFNYEWTQFTVNNPYLGGEAGLNKVFTVNKDCIIMRNDVAMQGMFPLFNKYATAMLENEISFDLASKNLRAISLITAPDGQSLKSANEFLCNIEKGDMASVQSNEFLDGVKVQPLHNGSDRTLSELIEYHQYLKASFFNEIGLNANYNMKREALTTTESQMNFDALLPLVDNMLECRQEAAELVNKMFNLNISVDFSSAWKTMRESLESLRNEDETETPDKSEEKAGEEHNEPETAEETNDRESVQSDV